MNQRRLAVALQRTPVWPALRSLHAAFAPATCSAAHALVTRAGTRAFTADTVLKHRFDYELLHLDPRRITRSLQVSAWRQASPANPSSPRERAQAWWTHGGGWKSCQRHLSRTFQGRFIIGGSWDQPAGIFRGRTAIVQLFCEGRTPSETDEYQLLAKRIEAGYLIHAHGCRTMDDLDAYFASMIRAFQSIRRDGYRTQQELEGEPGDEIRVCVLRSGELAVFGGGTHRLAMVRLLELPRVPVLVKRIHADWLRVPSDACRDDIVAMAAEAVTGLARP